MSHRIEKFLAETIDKANARIDRIAQSHGKLTDRHAELAALVAEATLAIEALEAKVDALLRLEDAKWEPGIDPPDIGALPDVGTTWTDLTNTSSGEGVT